MLKKETPYIYAPPRRKCTVSLFLARCGPGAIGDDDMKIWTTGTGPFVSGPLTIDLALKVTSRSHGTIGPAHAMSLTDFQTALADTQPDWTVEEP